MNDSILLSVKNNCGIMPEYEIFDSQILSHINTSISTLVHLGVCSFFYVSDDTSTWSEFMDYDAKEESIPLIRDYIQCKAKIKFDPPTVGALMESLKEQIAEDEWRLKVMHDKIISEEEVTSDGLYSS